MWLPSMLQNNLALFSEVPDECVFSGPAARSQSLSSPASFLQQDWWQFNT